MALMRWEKDQTVAIIYLDNGPNKQNLSFANELKEMLDEILVDKEVHALVLTSADEKNWSQGVDLDWMMTRFAEQDQDSVRAFMFRMNDVFKTLLLYPVPVIAAINGHAFGNGAMLACACDFRLMRADKGYLCFPEVDVGIPFLPGMIAWVKKAIPEHLFQEMKLTGRRLTAEELETHHVVRKACAGHEELMEHTLEFAHTFQKKRGIFGEMKKRMHRHIIEIMDTEDPKVIEPLNLMVMD